MPLALESRGCALLELRRWSLTMTGLRLALRLCSAAAAAWIEDAAISVEQRIVTSVFRILISAMLTALFRGRFCLSFIIFTFLRGLLRPPLKAAPEVACRRGHKQTSFKTQSHR